MKEFLILPSFWVILILTMVLFVLKYKFFRKKIVSPVSAFEPIEYEAYIPEDIFFINIDGIKLLLKKLTNEYNSVPVNLNTVTLFNKETKPYVIKKNSRIYL